MSDHPFTKETLDMYLKELAKEFRKRNGRSMPAEIVLIGGAAIVINYGFREMTYDMDAVIHASSSMKEAINAVGDKYGLPNGWMNADFMFTTSYSPKVSMYSRYYHTFSNVVTFRTVYREYLVAMKLMAGRPYKYDLSDIIGILLDHEKREDPISIDEIWRAVTELYGSADNMPMHSRSFIESVYANGDYEALYQRTREMESENKDILLQFQKDYPDVINVDNVDDVLDSIRKKKEEQEHE